MTTDTTTKAASKPTVKTLAQIMSAFTPLARSAVKDNQSYEVKCRQLADLIVDLRAKNTYKGKDATTNDDGSIKTPAVPAGTDWRGLSADYNLELSKVWNAAMPDDSPIVVNWIARTGKTVADFPLRKNVGYHLELALVARLGKPLCNKWGIETRTRAERKADAAKKRQANKKGPNETAATEFMVNGVPVAGNIVSALQTAQRAIDALEGRSVGLDVQATLFMLLTHLSSTASATATALVEVQKVAA